MLMQEFCEATGLTRDTVRFYVRRGLLTPSVGSGHGATAGPRSDARSTITGRVVPPSNRYRVFDAAQVERVRLIRSAQSLGFTLAEIARMSAAYETGGVTRERKASLLRAHLEALDDRAARLRAIRRYLSAKLRWLERGEGGAPPALPNALQVPAPIRRLPARGSGRSSTKAKYQRP